MQGVKIAREIFATKAFAPWVGDELMPADDPQTDDELRAFVRPTADSYHHQAGSCKMGMDDLAVVDPKLRVHGVEGLRVADASVMPQVQSGNCHAGIVMIAERLRRLRQGRSDGVGCGAGTAVVSLAGKKIGILIESDFYEHEIFYYQHRFPEEGRAPLPDPALGPAVAHLQRARVQDPVRGQRDLRGDERRGAAQLRAIIVPSAIVSDRLRYTEDVNKLPPASEFLARAFAEPAIIKGIICHGMWLVAPMPELVRGRQVVAHNNLHGDVNNMGAIYTDEDVVVDGDLVTGRTGGHCHLFARAIIDMIAAKEAAAVTRGRGRPARGAPIMGNLEFHTSA